MKKFTYILLSLLFTLAFHCDLTAQPPTRVYVSKISLKTITPSIELSGSAEYPELSNLSTEVSGIVENIYFDEGDVVKKGAVLLELNSDILRKELEISKAEHLIAMEESELKKWEFERYDTLFSSGDIPLRDLKQKETEYLKSKYMAERAASRLALLEITLEKKKIRSPFNGVVVKKMTHTGNWLQEGMTVAVIASNDFIDIVCNAPQSVIGEISKGDAAEIIHINETIKAKVFSAIPYGDVNTRTFPVKIRLKNKYDIVGGMELRVKLHTSKPRDSFIIPRDALVIKSDRYYIYIADNSVAKEIPVEVIGYEGKNAEVQSKMIRDKMNVIIRGNQFLQDNQKIEIVK
jgi:membrane fusion protein, multidrug efflux system